MSQRTSWIAVLSAAMFTVSLEAQSVSVYAAGSIDKHWDRDAGPAEVAFDLEGGYRRFVSGTAGVARRNSADALAAATVGIYGASIEAAAAEAEFEVVDDDGVCTGEYSVVGRVLGFTLYNKSDSGSATMSKSFEKSLSWSRLVASYNFTLGPIPVTVHITVGSSLDIELTAALLPTSLALSLAGDVRATAGECEFTCGVGFASGYVGLGAGVFTEIDFGRVDLHAAALVMPGLATLTFEWTVSAICLELGVKAWAYVLGLRKEWSETLFEQCWGTFSGSMTV